MSKTHFEEFKDLIELAHNTLNRIKTISKEKSRGWENPLGFLGFILLFCSVLQTLAIQEGADMTQALMSQLNEKRQEVRYVA